jgi:hypothetical protein
MEMPTVGQITLISDTTAYCKVSWSTATDGQGTCSFSVYIPSFRGESWQARRQKAVAEARRIAKTFLDTVQPPEETAC